MIRCCAAIVLGMSVMMGGCASSPPLHYYTLTEIPGSNRLTVAEKAVPLRLDRVTIPAELDRSQLVRRIDATQLQIVENDRWAAPLEDTIRRVLSADLTNRLPAGMVTNPFEPAVGDKRQSLSVDIEELYGDSGCAVTLRAAWVIKQPDMGSSHGSVETTVPAGGSCSSGVIPAGMSQALAQLSDRLAAAVADTGAGAR